MEDPSMVTFSNSELNSAPLLGKMSYCPHCHKQHEVLDSTPPLLQFVKCSDGMEYLVGLKGKDVSGSFPRKKEGVT